MNREFDPMRPATYLTPAGIAQLDQWEAEVSDVLNNCVEMFRELEQDHGPQDLATWAALLISWLSKDRLAIITAYLLRSAARKESE